MVTTPFSLESPNVQQGWNLTVDDDSGDLLFNANLNFGGDFRMSIEDDGGGITIETVNDNNWAIQIDNSASVPATTTGMRVTDNGFFEITSNIGASGRATLDNTGAWTVASDLQCKKDVETASNLLEKALSLNPINFYYKKQDLNELPHKLMGFIAQEVEEILPHAVVGTETKYLNYNAIVPVAIGAIKEMKEYYDDKIANLETQLEQIKEILVSSKATASD
jgi:hypothetical protein